MGIKDKGYGEGGVVGFDPTIERDSDGKASTFMTPDKFPVGKHYLEVVSLDVFENKDGKDFLKVWLFDPRHGLMTSMFGEIKTNTMWKLERAIRGIFGKVIPIEKVQGPGGRMPMETRTTALGVFVEVEIKNSDYEGQDVLIVGDKPYAAPEGMPPMFSYTTHEATGKWPTSASELLAKRGGGKATKPKPKPDGEDW